MKKTIGVIVPTTDNTFFSELVFQLERKLDQCGYQTIIFSSANDADKEKENLRLLADLNVCGVIDVSGLNVFDEDALPEDMPLVFVDRRPETTRRVPWVANDDREAMKQAAEFLIEKGCKNIVLMPGYVAEKGENPRVLGYKSALEQASLDFDIQNVLNREGKKTSEEETAELVMNLLKDGKKIDGIITSSDRAAFGAITALRTTGYYVPEDVRLISFDNSPYAAMSSPNITSIDRNPAELASKAVYTLETLMREGKADDVVVPVSLIKRDSTR